MQRISGCSFSFREASRAVLRSAKGLSSPSPRNPFTIPSTLPLRSLESRQSCVRDDFMIACNMLQSERYDTKILALESLEQMTASCPAVDVAAKSVLSCDPVASCEVEKSDRTDHTIIHVQYCNGTVPLYCTVLIQYSNPYKYYDQQTLLF